MTVRILIGDVRTRLKELPDESVHCVVTSPPYWGLRDYGVAGQLGLEPTLGEHVETMADIFDEVRRVLRKDGTLWLNYGDSYAASPNGKSAAAYKADGSDDRTFRDKPFSTVGPIHAEVGRLAVWDRKSERGGHNFGAADDTVANVRILPRGILKPKDLCGIPWRVAFALQERGWWLRQDIIWSKPNPMPESIKDRCTKAHEYIFMLTKSARYYYDADAISEPAIYSGLSGQDESGFKDAYAYDGKHSRKAVSGTYGHGAGRNDGDNHPSGGWKPRKRDKQRGHSRKHAGFNERWDQMEKVEQCSGYRNKRSVWEIATSPFPEAHFATFPPELPEICIKAGCPNGGTVLDPFGGAGTTGLVADRLGRNAILIELNREYAAMAQRRIHGDAPLFVEVEAAE